MKFDLCLNKLVEKKIIAWRNTNTNRNGGIQRQIQMEHSENIIIIGIDEEMVKSFSNQYKIRQK